jgi:osmotically-inducible protein OsmY
MITASSIAQQAFNAVALHPQLKQAKVAVQTDAGDVTISGTVQSFYQKQMAQESLRDIDGIDSIANQLRVEWN